MAAMYAILWRWGWKARSMTEMQHWRDIPHKLHPRFQAATVFLPSSKASYVWLECVAVAVIWQQQSMATTCLLHARQRCMLGVACSLVGL